MSDIIPIGGYDEEPQRDIYIWDTSNPRSIINIAPDSMRVAMNKALELNPELFSMDEVELTSHLYRNRQYRPTPTDNRIRLNFWLEYDRCQVTNQKMRLSNIISNVCSAELYQKTLIKNINKVAWILCPPVDYVTKCREALAFNLDQLRSIIDIPHIGDNGKIDHKLIEAKIRIFKIIDDRVQGAVVQRLQIHGTMASPVERNAVTSMVLSLQEEVARDNAQRQAQMKPDEIMTIDTMRKVDDGAESSGT